MAYTRVWDNAAPPGTAAANTIDTIFNEFREDVNQRLSSILLAGTDIDDDPLQLNASITGAQTARVLTFGPHMFQPFDDEDDIQYNISYVQSDNDGAAMLASITIPLGYVVTKWEVTLDKNGGASASGTIYTLDVQSGANVLVAGPIARVAAGVGSVSSIIATTINSNQCIAIVVSGSGAGARYRVYGVRITIDRSSSALSY